MVKHSGKSRSSDDSPLLTDRLEQEDDEKVKDLQRGEALAAASGDEFADLVASTVYL